MLDPARILPATILDLVRALMRGEFPVYRELAAQVRKIVSAGIRPSHLDTHKHTHLLPPVLDAVARLAHEFGIPWVRRPFDFGIDADAAHHEERRVAGDEGHAAPFCASRFCGVKTTDHFAGFQITGAERGAV